VISDPKQACSYAVRSLVNGTETIIVKRCEQGAGATGGIGEGSLSTVTNVRFVCLFACGLFNDTVSSSVDKIWKEVLVAEFNVLSCQLPGGSEKKHERLLRIAGLGRELNPGPPECATGEPTTREMSDAELRRWFYFCAIYGG
jgi:hypothetical protein